MKKIPLLLFLLLTIQTAIAGNISLEKARSVAEKVLSGNSTRVGLVLTLVNADEVAQTRSDLDACAYYIFNSSEGGFVIVPSIDAAHPVLAYSNNHSFSLDSSMPDGLSEWLSEYKKQINERRASGIPASSEELAEWTSILTGTRATASTVVDLDTPEWDQKTPFNNLCPVLSNGDHAVTGCVATAIGELMYYYRYPKCGLGTLPAYTSVNGGETIAIPSLELGEEYDWDNMLRKYSGVEYTDKQARSVATLCYHIGVMAQAKYGSSTVANTVDAVDGLVRYFGYDKGYVEYSKNFFSLDEWKSRLKSYLDAKKPLLMRGNNSKTGTGHAFIMEGYDSNDMFLMNWGWGGSSNGFYELSALKNYTVDQKAVFDVKPNEGSGRKDAYIYMRKGVSSSSGNRYYGLTFLGGNICPDSVFYIRAGTFRHSGREAFNGYIDYALVDKSGDIKELLQTRSIAIGEGGSGKWQGSPKISLKVSPNTVIKEGYCIKAFYHTDESEEKKPVLYSLAEADSLCGQLPCYVSDYAAVEYDRNDKVLTVSTFPGDWSECSLVDQSGGVVGKQLGYDRETGVLRIDTSEIGKGDYRLIFRFGGKKDVSGNIEYIQSHTMNITF